MLPYIQQWADSAAGMDGEAVFRAFSQFHATRVATVDACRAFDYVISPTSPVPAFAAELPSPTNDPLRPLEHIGFTVPFNMSEQPAASINCGYTARRPADRPADRRPALRRPGRAAGRARLRTDHGTASGRGRSRPPKRCTMWTDSLGNEVTLESEASLGPLNDFVEGFIASEARAVNIVEAASRDPSPIVQACAAAVHMFAETRDARRAMPVPSCERALAAAKPMHAARAALHRRPSQPG